MERSHVAQGEGFFHLKKPQYSKDTQDLLKVLMEESKLTIIQKQHIQQSVNRGDPLPPPLTPTTPPRASNHGDEVLMLASASKRRTQHDIARSGAYDREQFYPEFPKVDKEKEKEKFRSLMTYGKVVPPTPKGVAEGKSRRFVPKREPPKERDTFLDLVDEVRDRADFLAEMRELGLEKKYRQTITQEIAAKIRLMEAIDKQRCREFDELVGDYRWALGDSSKHVLPSMADIGQK